MQKVVSEYRVSSRQKKFHHTTWKLQIKHAKIPVLSALSTECFLLFDGMEFGGWAPIPSIPLIEYEVRGTWTPLFSIFILTSEPPFAISSLVGLILSALLIRFRTILLMELTLGTLSVVHTPSLKSRSRISQANMVGFARLYSAILLTTGPVATFGLLPPITPGLMEPVS